MLYVMGTRLWWPVVVGAPITLIAGEEAMVALCRVGRRSAAPQVVAVEAAEPTATPTVADVVGTDLVALDSQEMAVETAVASPLLTVVPAARTSVRTAFPRAMAASAAAGPEETAVAVVVATPAGPEVLTLPTSEEVVVVPSMTGPNKITPQGITRVTVASASHGHRNREPRF